jgi:hypothetical protein
MPRFFFDVVLDGATEPDGEGLDLPNVLAARAEATRAAAEMVRDRAADDIELTIVIRDEQGETLFQVAALLRIEPNSPPHAN